MTPQVSIMETTVNSIAVQNLAQTHRGSPAQRASAAYPRVPAVMMWLASAIALAVMASRWIDLESSAHLILVWLLLWAIVGSSFLLLAGTVQRMAQRAQAGWAQWAQQRAEAADWAVAMRDHRVSADLLALDIHLSSRNLVPGAPQGSQSACPGSEPLSP
ncbi:MAG: hypothetical protein RL459_1405, partial [Pseudomonadota bacterium]